jgi:predicted HD phosphohydrolase
VALVCSETVADLLRETQVEVVAHHVSGSEHLWETIIQKFITGVEVVIEDDTESIHWRHSIVQ